MQVGASIYGYRNNINCNRSSVKKAKSTKIKLFNLIIDGYRTASRFDDDYFVSIAQYLMRKGYPREFQIGSNTENLYKFFMQSLFSVNTFRWEDLLINYQFDVFEWRKQFDLFNEIKISELNYYRNRASMPIPNFKLLIDIYKVIFGGKNELLKFSFNHCHTDAVYIIAKSCLVKSDRFYYIIAYGCKYDHDNKLTGIPCSSWDITIESEINENYVDFCMRIHDNYEAILSGSKEVLESKFYQNDDKNFYLGGNFKLKK